MTRFQLCNLAFGGALLVVLTAGALKAQPQSEAAAQNMQRASDLCLREYCNAAALPQAFVAASFNLAPGRDVGTFNFEAPGVSALFVTDPAQVYGTVQFEGAALAMDNATGLALSNRLFPGMGQPGGPEALVGTPVGPFDGLSILAPQGLIRISRAAAGNSGECLNDGTSAIIIVM